MREDSRGLAQLQVDRQSPLNLFRHHNSLSPRNSNPLRSYLALLPLLLMRKDGNSPSCSATWWTPRNSPANSTPKSTETWSVPINLLVRKSSHALMDTLRSY